MQYRDRQSLGPLQTEIAEDNKEPELGASPGPRLGRKAAERKAGREGSLRGSSWESLLSPSGPSRSRARCLCFFHILQPQLFPIQSPFSPLSPHTVIQLYCVQARWVPSQSSSLLPLPGPLSHPPLPFTLEAQPSGQGTPSLTAGLGSCTPLAPQATAHMAAGLWFLLVCLLRCKMSFSRVGPWLRWFLSLEHSLVLAHTGLLRNSFHRNNRLIRFVFHNHNCPYLCVNLWWNGNRHHIKLIILTDYVNICKPLEITWWLMK